MEIRAFRAEAIARHPEVVCKLQPETAAGIRCPHATVLAAERAAAGPHGDGWAGIGPLQDEVDIAAMAASADLSHWRLPANCRLGRAAAKTQHREVVKS